MKNLIGGLLFAGGLISLTFSLALGFGLMLLLCAVDWAFEKTGNH